MVCRFLEGTVRKLLFSRSFRHRIHGRGCDLAVRWEAVGGSFCMTYTNRDSIVIRRSVRYSKEYVIGGLICILISFVFLWRSAVFPFLIVMLCGLLVLIAGVLSSRDRDAQIVIDEQGIGVKGRERTDWKQIRSARRESWPRGLEIIILELRDSKNSKIQLQVHGLEMPPSTIFDLILLHTHQAESSSS